MSILALNFANYAGNDYPKYFTLNSTDDFATITTQGYLDALFSDMGVVCLNGDWVQAVYGADATLSTTFVEAIDPVSGSTTLVPGFGLNMS